MNNIIPFIARVLIGVMYLKAGISHAMDFEGMVKSLADKNVGIPAFFAASAIGMLLLGSVMMITGFKTKLGAFLLLIFLVPTTLIYHVDFSNPMQVGMFLNHLVMVGALLMVISFGGGNFGVDGLLSKKEPQI